MTPWPGPSSALRLASESGTAHLVGAARDRHEVELQPGAGDLLRVRLEVGRAGRLGRGVERRESGRS